MTAPARRTFALALRAHLEPLGPRSHAAVARNATIDPSYLDRLVAGARLPSRVVVHALARALGLTLAEERALLAAAGYLPTPWTMELEAVTAALTDPRLTRFDLEMFRARLIDLTTDTGAMLTRRAGLAPSWEVTLTEEAGPRLVDLERERIPSGIA